MSGYGKMYIQNGDFYEGNFRNGRMSGKGLYTWKNGNKYFGDFKND